MAVTFHRIERIVIGDTHAPGGKELTIITGFPANPGDQRDVWLQMCRRRESGAIADDAKARRGELRASDTLSHFMNPLIVDLARLPERADDGAWTAVIDTCDDLLKLENAVYLGRPDQTTERLLVGIPQVRHDN